MTKWNEENCLKSLNSTTIKNTMSLKVEDSQRFVKSSPGEYE